MKTNLVDELLKLYAGQDGWVKFYVRTRVRLLNIHHYSELLPHQGLIIDIGCGYGVLANYLSLHLSNNRILGIDLDHKRIAAANMTINNRKNITFRTEDAKESALPTCTGIVMTDFLHHVCPSDQRKILENAFRSLKKGGILVIAEADPGAKPFYRYWASYMSDRVLYPLSKSYFRKSEDWENILSSLGFKIEIVKLQNPVFAGILFICRK